MFGKVVKGQDIVETMQALPKGKNDRPIKLVRIAKCGEIEVQKSVQKYAPVQDYTEKTVVKQ